MFRNCLLAFLFIGAQVLHAQPNEGDSLKQALKKPGLSLPDRIEIYRQLGRMMLDIDPRTTIVYADSALEIAQNNPGGKELAALHSLKGQAYRRQSIYADALKEYNEALKFAHQSADRSAEAKIYMELATIGEMTGELVRALELNQKALDMLVELKDSTSIVTIYNNIGIIYMHKEDFDGAITYYKKAIELNNLLGNTTANARTINNIGLVFQKNHQLDSALIYFNRALASLDIGKQKYGYALINNNIGLCYRLLKKYDKALASFEVAKKLQRELNDLYGLGLVNYNIAQVYQLTGEHRKGLRALEEAAEYAMQANSLSLLSDVAERSAFSYEQIGDFRNAFAQQRKSKMYTDSAQAKSLSKEIADLEVRYQVKQKQAEIDLLKSQNELHLANSRNKDLVLLTIVGFSVLILTLLALAYRALRIKQKTNAIIREKNEKLELLNHEKNSLMAIVAHDLISPLNSIGGIANILPSLGPLNPSQKEFVNVISDVVESSRTLVKDVMDLSALENKELKVNLEPVAVDALLADCKARLASESIRKEIKLEIVSGESIEPVRTDKGHLDRILQNLVSNALKFSNSGTTVRMGAYRDNGSIRFFVSDQGPGISPEDQKLLFRKFMKLSARPTSGESSTGLGLSIVKGLVEELGGDIVVDSEPGKGTTFTFHVPVN